MSEKKGHRQDVYNLQTSQMTSNNFKYYKCVLTTDTSTDWKIENSDE